jgi:hypothetical protein
MTTLAHSNRLTVLAAEVKNKLTASADAERSAIEAALDAGAKLCEAKASCGHGDWLPFLDAAGVPERKAQRYMRLARSGLKSDTVSDLGGIKAALRWLEQLRLPTGDEALIVSDDGFREDSKGLVAVIYQEVDGHRFAIFNLSPADAWVDTLSRPIIKSDFIWPALFSLFNHRCADMDFAFVPAREAVAWLESLAELPMNRGTRAA